MAMKLMVVYGRVVLLSFATPRRRNAPSKCCNRIRRSLSKSSELCTYLGTWGRICNEDKGLRSFVLLRYVIASTRRRKCKIASSINEIWQQL